MNEKSGTLHKKIAVVAILAAAALLPASLVFTQTTKSGFGLGKISKPGEVQQGLKPDAPSKVALTKMHQEKDLAPLLIQGKVHKMEDHLDKPVAAVGDAQPQLDKEKAVQPPKGKGLQLAKPVAAGPQTTYLHMVFSVTAEGKTELISAVEVPGDVIHHEEPTGHFIYEVLHGKQGVVAQAIPDPFEMRSFAPKGSPLQGHHIERAKTARIVVKAPKTSLANMQTLHIRLYKLKPGGRPLEKINLETLNVLRQDKRVELHFDLPAAQLTPQIEKIGRKHTVPLK